jgi:hypothetical protein
LCISSTEDDPVEEDFLDYPPLELLAGSDAIDFGRLTVPDESIALAH